MSSPSPEIVLTLADGRAMWRDSTGRTVPVIRGGDGEDTAATTIDIPEDLTGLEPEALEALRTQVTDEFDRLADLSSTSPADVTSEHVAAATQLATAIQALDAEDQRRADAAAAEQAEQQERADAIANLAATVHPDQSGEPADGDDAEGAEGDDAGEGEEPPAEGDGATDAGAVAASGGGPITVPATPRRSSLNLAVADIAKRAPRPRQRGNDRPGMVVTAGDAVPGFGHGEALSDVDAVRTAMYNRVSRTAGTAKIASIQRDYPLVVDGDRTSLSQMQALIQELTAPAQTRAGMEALVAAGGWCAPSEIRYDFFNIAEMPLTWDAPTFGVQRGGVRWPISMSLADFFALSGAPASGVPANDTVPWLWTELDDILASTGSPVKLCLTPECPEFDEERLWLLGICVRNGNLANDAFPELINDFIAKLMVAHERVMNRRRIGLAAAMSTAVAGMTEGDSGGVVSAVVGAFALQATDYRTKHGTSANAVMEGVLPHWSLEPMRSDLRRRNGWDDLAVADSFLASLFDAIDVRIQFVEDWQTLPGSAGPANTIGAATPPTNWPATVTGMLYAPGTFSIGNGMRLDLGVHRDTTTNEVNDYIAAWSEEASLVAMFGHESRTFPIDICANGASGGQGTVASCGV